jgi:hypothetical protein
MKTPSVSRQLYVCKVGRDFAVEDPTVGKDSDYRGLRIFDSKWVYRRTYLTYLTPEVWLSRISGF